MATITNGQITENVRYECKIQPQKDKLPQMTKDDIQPVLIANNRFSTIRKSVTQTATADSTIYSIPSDPKKDFYLTSIQLAYSKDVTSDNINVSVLATIDGQAANMLSLQSQTLTAYSDHDNIAYTFPIKLDTGTTILLTGAFTVGTITKRAIIMGFYI
jgi:hypothetical protein